MSQERRSVLNKSTGKIDSGIMMAKVVGYLDPTFMAGLEVTLLRDQGNEVGDIHQTYSIKYSTPFYGATGYEYMGLNKSDYNDTQKSYGMWFPPPEIGTTILVAFVDGNPAEGYFIACVPGKFMNHMIPAIGSSVHVELTDEDKKKYDTDQPLPVAEVNRKTNSLETGPDIDKIKKPVHPVANRFLEQGLLEDDVRGPATSTSRRNVPNSVYGISTPGPVDRRNGAKQEFIGKKQTKSANTVPVGRLGGTQLVMDDGDDRYRRASTATSGPPQYFDNLDEKENRTGKPDIPYNEYTRLRTRTGHQILLHNSEDLIYIGNSRGTAWIELTSHGKIDIFAQDSISIHTEADINMRADRDINFEAGRNINMRTAKGRMHVDINGNLEIAAASNALLTTLGDLHLRTTGSSKISSGVNLDISSGGSNKISCSAEMDVLAGGALIIDAAGTLSAKGADIIMQGGSIHMNGPSALAATAADEADSTELLSLFDNPATSSKNKWGDKNRYRTDISLRSIMRRIPMHEPWSLHENINPVVLASQFTDRDRQDTPTEE
jgi:starvation-inducible outer membrane lipoprotein